MSGDRCFLVRALLRRLRPVTVLEVKRGCAMSRGTFRCRDLGSMTLKTQILNRVRAKIINTSLEERLAGLTRGKKPSDFWGRLVPANTLFPRPSIREVEREGLRFRLDVSNFVDHIVYFGLSDDHHQLFFDRLRPDDCVIDVGANIGAFSLRCAKRVIEGRVFSFEPDPDNYAHAKVNFELNAFKHMRLIHQGLSDHEGEAELVCLDPHNTGTNRIVGGHQGVAKARISLTTLDAFVAAEGLSRVDAIKVDVEGHEYQVLMGAMKTLMRFQPMILVEMSSKNLAQQGTSVQKVAQLIENLGYKILNIDSGRWLMASEVASPCHFDALCLPQDAEKAPKGHA